MPLGATSPNTVLDSAAHLPDLRAAKKESVEEETAKMRIYQPNKVFQKIKQHKHNGQKMGSSTPRRMLGCEWGEVWTIAEKGRCAFISRDIKDRAESERQ